MMILRAGFLGPHLIATSVFLAALVILFCGFAYQIGRLVLGEQPRGRSRVAPDPETLDLGMGVTLVAALVAVVSTFYLPGPLMGLDPCGCRCRLGGGMSTVTTAIAARVEDRRVQHPCEPRPGEVAIEVPAADLPALADAAVADLDGRLAVAVRRRRASHARTLRRASRLVAATARDVSCASRLRSIRPRPRFPRSPPGIRPRTGSSGK